VTVGSKSPVPSLSLSPHVMVASPWYPVSHVAAHVPAQAIGSAAQLLAPLAIVGAAHVIAEYKKNIQILKHRQLLT